MSTAVKQKKVVPELRFCEFSGEWEVKKLEELLSEPLTNGESVLPDERAGEATQYGLVEISHIFQSGINLELDNLSYLHSVKQGATLSQGDVIINRVSIKPSGVGKVVAVVSIPEGITLSFESNMFRVRLNRKDVDSSFFTYFGLTDYYNRQKIAKAKTGNQASLSQSDVKELKVPVPQLQEQQKIADFLGSVDAWLQNLKAQKAALETYKRGMMQKLFTQQIRFKDDNGNDFPKWQKKELGSVFKAVKGNGLSKDSLDSSGANECILYGELYTTYSEVISNIKSRTNLTEGTLSKKGDLLMPSSTTTTAIDLANATALNKENVQLGGDITVLRGVNEVSNIFYAYYLSNHKKNELAKYGQGVTIIHIYYSHFKDMTIDVPSLPEQQKIADFLSALDQTISDKAAEITKVEQWKKGLMQKMFV